MTGPGRLHVPGDGHHEHYWIDDTGRIGIQRGGTILWHWIDGATLVQDGSEIMTDAHLEQLSIAVKVVKPGEDGQIIVNDPREFTSR